MFTSPLCTGAEVEGEANLGVVSGCKPGLVEVFEEPPADVPPVDEELPEPVLAELPALGGAVVVALVPAVVELEPLDPQPANDTSAPHAIAIANSDLFAELTEAS